MLITKEDSYRARGDTYELDDEEALIRYQNAARWISPREKLVVREVGCKFAIIREILDSRAQGTDWKAIDIDQATLNGIPRYSAAQFIRHDARDGLPFPDGSADYVLSLEVMEHLERPTDFLNEVRRVLKPAGRLILSVLNPYCWMEWLANSRKERDIEGHISTFTHQNIDALLCFAGLRLLDMKGTFTRVPFSRRLRGRYWVVRTFNLLLSRSFMFLVEKP